MALKPLANEDGDIVINEDGELDPDGEYTFQSLGDPRSIAFCCDVTSSNQRFAVPAPT